MLLKKDCHIILFDPLVLKISSKKSVKKTNKLFIKIAVQMAAAEQGTPDI